MNEKELKAFASEARKNCLFCIGSLGVGHIGGALSIVDILTYLYNGEMRNLDPKNPRKEDRDMLVVSKGHSGPAPSTATGLQVSTPGTMHVSATRASCPNT